MYAAFLNEINISKQKNLISDKEQKLLNGIIHFHKNNINKEFIKSFIKVELCNNEIQSDRELLFILNNILSKIDDIFK
jgi:hypothetical protein